ncbi:MAG: hypothetical protein ACLRMJ_11215 [Alistipes finegoldii]
MNLLKIHVFSACGQRRRQPDIGFVEEGLMSVPSLLSSLMLTVTVASGSEFVADDDAVRSISDDQLFRYTKLRA